MLTLRLLNRGVSWVGGIVKRPLPPNVADNRAIVTAFGRKGLFAYSSGSPASSNELMWLSAFATEEPPSRDSITIKEIAADVRKRYGAWGDPVVRDIVSTAPIETVYPIWVLPDLPHWGQDGIVLVGDAAHAMSPTTAQGACQALEDAQALALLLCETLRKAYDSGEKLDKGADIWPQKERDAVELSIRLLFTIRSPRVSGIAEAGRQLDRKRRNLTRFKEYAMYLFLWLMFRLSSLGK
ncbi:hypothetical protein N656DRAFT_773978 [Canariomyces notabilis]|uniref:FAD-binding domain-containing protein n=1 Tax=Canariomyces notabilis TaxID=2074819 RepID=A0AAN6YXI3_9PEZI|nr:hypothetical protein N656DRAFT_773978 [Canariomyces arenarius]